MATTTVDAVVLGMGPGGEMVAGALADAGLEVVGIDQRLAGGECPYWGCIPSKIMIRAADALAEAGRVDQLAGHADVTPDWAPVAERVREATSGWDDTAAVERFEDRGGTFVRGRGRLVGPRAVEVGDRTFEARRAVVVATGTEPAVPPIDGLADTPFWTNREAIEAKDLPGSLVVLGGGAIGVELAQAFARFGVVVTVVEGEDQLVPAEDPAVAEVLAEVFEDEGITVRTGTRAETVDHRDGRFVIGLDDGTTLGADQLLVATGRSVDLSGIGAGAIGCDEDAKTLPVDEHLRVTDGVWAVGDVTGKGAFTHVATYQATIAAADILGNGHEPADYAAVPRVTYTDPEIGSVGRTEQAARDAGHDVAVGVASLPTTSRGFIHGPGNDGTIRLVADRATGTLVGATAMGPNGGEVLGLLTLAVHARVPIAQLRTMIPAFPTFHRGIQDALDDLGI
ncbi:MAG: NAD(P)/FAD-dependent oxidoreductase [Actinomycetota bacterium]|nr:NAD(P)/FAD-dependent oxidoreductase [Actinomycetota bacterium]